LTHPGQALVNYSHLKFLLSTMGPQKSILRWLEAERRTGGPDTASGRANTVVNNFFDIEYFRRLVTDPRSAPEFVNGKFFESVGHSFSIAYGNVSLLLAETLGGGQGALPDARILEQEFSHLRRTKVEGFARGGSLRLSPLGARQLFEGQARFMQLQFLHFAAPEHWTWEIAKAAGLLSGVYVEAFEAFLRLAGLEWPPSVDHQTVGLFLLVCDLAINPGAAFPLPLKFPKTFLVDVDPGMRFLFLCRAVARAGATETLAVMSYSKDQYLAASDTLADLLIVDSPTKIFQTVASWPERVPAVRRLMDSHDKSEYEPVNFAVRLLFAHFIAFARDKSTRPELFCWPGAWMAGERVSRDSVVIFDRHSAPFVDKADASGIFPRLRRGRNVAVDYESFSNFYAMNVTLGLMRQWIVEPGPFRYDYDWLGAASAAEMKGYGDRHFEMAFGVSPDRFRIL